MGIHFSLQQRYTIRITTYFIEIIILNFVLTSENVAGFINVDYLFIISISAIKQET